MLRWVLSYVGGQVVDTTTSTAKDVYSEGRVLTNRTYAYLTDKSKTPEQHAKQRDEFHASMAVFKEKNARRKALYAAETLVETPKEKQLFGNCKDEISSLIIKTEMDIENLHKVVLHLMNRSAIKDKLEDKAFLEYLTRGKTLKHLQMLITNYPLDNPEKSPPKSPEIKALLEKIAHPEAESALRYR